MVERAAFQPLRPEDLFVPDNDGPFDTGPLSITQDELTDPIALQAMSVYAWKPIADQQKRRERKRIVNIMLATMYRLPPSLYDKDPKELTTEQYSSATERDLPRLVDTLGNLATNGQAAYVKYFAKGDLKQKYMAQVHDFASDSYEHPEYEGVHVTYPRALLMDRNGTIGYAPLDLPMAQSTYVSVPQEVK